MPSELERIVGALTKLGKDADSLRGFVAEAVREQRALLAELHRLAAIRPEVRDAMGAVQASVNAAEGLDPELAKVNLAAAHFARRVLGGGAGARGTGSTTAQPSTAEPPAESADPGPASAQAGADAAFDPAPYLAKLPVRDRSPHSRREKTRGIWVDGGNEHDLISGEDEPEYQRAVEHAWRIGLVVEPHILDIASHVEIKFAMRMSEGQRATIVINNAVCDGAYACDTLLKRFLPARAELDVYGPDGFHKTYRGEGETR